MNKKVVEYALFAVFFAGISLNCWAAVAQQLPENSDGACEQSVKRSTCSATAQDIVHLKKQVALVKKMVVEMGNKLEYVEQNLKTITRSCKSVDQILREHEWISVMTNFFSTHAYSLISTACAVIGLYLSYYFNKQQILLAQAQLMLSHNTNALRYLHEFVQGDYDAYFSHVKQGTIAKSVS